MLRRLIALTAVAVAAAGCIPQAGHAGGRSSPTSAVSAPSAAVARDPRTATALLKIATAFNREYDIGDYGPVYDQWDARSHAIITRAEYIRRRTECPSASYAAAQVESTVPGPHGAWLVDYEISGEWLTDYWFYVHGRWVFDLVLSNPDAVKLYKLSPQQYAKAAGCSH